LLLKFALSKELRLATQKYDEPVQSAALMQLCSRQRFNWKQNLSPTKGNANWQKSRACTARLAATGCAKIQKYVPKFHVAMLPQGGAAENLTVYFLLQHEC